MSRFFVVIASLLFFSNCSQGSEPAAPVTATEATTHAEDRATAQATIGGHRVSVEYGRPALQGRDMIAQATPGMIWRLGMNEATTLTTESDLRLGDATIPKGTYTIFAKHIGPEQWHLIVNNKTGLWGAYEHNPELDIAEVLLEWSTSPESIEYFTIEVAEVGESEGNLVLKWGTSRLTVGFEVLS